MKKVISILCTIMFLFSLLGFTTFATDVPNEITNSSPVTISEDYRTLSIDGHTYSRFNISMLEVKRETSETNIVLSHTQHEQIEDIEMRSSEQRKVISATFYFKDGSYLGANFLRDDCREQYDSLLNNQASKYSIDFMYPDGNVVTAKGKHLFGKVVTLEQSVIEECDVFDVTTSTDKGELTVRTGALLTYEDDYYYVDYAESKVDEGNRHSIWEYENPIIHKVTDEELVQKLSEAQEEYWNDNFGFFDNDKFTESISAIFLIFVFVLIPLAIFVVFLIFAIRTKGVYKKMCRITYILCGAEILIFALISTLMLVHG